MLELVKPQKLKRGDTIATVSLSWGGAGDPDILWRYEKGKERLETIFGLHVTKMPNTLKGTKYLYEHPEKRAEDLPWQEENKNKKRKFHKNNGYQLLQGNGVVRGKLIGGCMEVMEMIKGTTLFPSLTDFNYSILFFETSEEMPTPDSIVYWLRNYGAMGVLDCINGIVFGKPYHEKYYEEYIEAILKVMKEYKKDELPILYNLSFGHCEPKCLIPYGVMAEINCDEVTFSILENGVIE